MSSIMVTGCLPIKKPKYVKFYASSLGEDLSTLCFDKYHLPHLQFIWLICGKIGLGFRSLLSWTYMERFSSIILYLFIHPVDSTKWKKKYINLNECLPQLVKLFWSPYLDLQRINGGWALCVEGKKTITGLRLWELPLCVKSMPLFFSLQESVQMKDSNREMNVALIYKDRYVAHGLHFIS